MRVLDLIHGTQGSLFGPRGSSTAQSPVSGFGDGESVRATSPQLADKPPDRRLPVRYYFDSYCVDPVNRQLTKDGQPIPLTPLTFNALLFLVVNSGRLVPKGELLATIWPDTSVDAPNLAVMISTVRKALGDNGHSQKYIKTVAKAGYRFVADVRAGNLDRPATVANLESRQSWLKVRFPVLLKLGLLLLIASIVSIYSFEKSAHSTLSPNLNRIHGRQNSLPQGSSPMRSRPEERNSAVDQLHGQARASYLKGRYSWSRGTEEGLQQSIVYFNQSIAEDPKNALAYAGLADAYASLATWSVQPSATAYTKAQAAARRAVELDDSLSEAHSSLGLIAMYRDWNWRVAETEYRRALELGPHDALAHERYGMYLASQRRFDESLEQMRTARDLEPVSLYMALSVGRVLYYSRRYSEAIAEYKKVIDLDPHFSSAHYYLGLVYFSQAKFNDAEREFDRAATLVNGREPLTTGLHAAVLAREGRTSEAQAEVAKLLERSRKEYVSPLSIGFAYMGLGERANALDWIERMFQDHIVTAVFTGIDPVFDSLRAETRFAKLVQRLDLSTTTAQISMR